ncbi:MAG: hypothetical protein V8T10_00105 [Merdibacter sp.]
MDEELDGVFKALFGGGRASLVIVDPDDVLDAGIDIDVAAPAGSSRTSARSPAEALIAISVLFAVLKARTMPLCVSG